jgi:hypothetical protein
MKTLGSKSISSFLKTVITVAWYLEFLLLLTLPLVFMDEGGLTYTWPLTLHQAEAAPRITAGNPGITGLRLHENCYQHGQIAVQVLSFEDGTTPRKLLQTLHNLVYIAAIMLITWLLKKIFSGLADNQPFSTENAIRIRWPKRCYRGSIPAQPLLSPVRSLPGMTTVSTTRPSFSDCCC